MAKMLYFFSLLCYHYSNISLKIHNLTFMGFFSRKEKPPVAEKAAAEAEPKKAVSDETQEKLEQFQPALDECQNFDANLGRFIKDEVLDYGDKEAAEETREEKKQKIKFMTFLARTADQKGDFDQQKGIKKFGLKESRPGELDKLKFSREFKKTGIMKYEEVLTRSRTSQEAIAAARKIFDDKLTAMETGPAKKLVEDKTALAKHLKSKGKAQTLMEAMSPDKKADLAEKMADEEREMDERIKDQQESLNDQVAEYREPFLNRREQLTGLIKESTAVFESLKTEEKSHSDKIRKLDSMIRQAEGLNLLGESQKEMVADFKDQQAQAKADQEALAQRKEEMKSRLDILKQDLKETDVYLKRLDKLGKTAEEEAKPIGANVGFRGTVKLEGEETEDSDTADEKVSPVVPEAGFRGTIKPEEQERERKEEEARKKKKATAPEAPKAPEKTPEPEVPKSPEVKEYSYDVKWKKIRAGLVEKQARPDYFQLAMLASVSGEEIGDKDFVKAMDELRTENNSLVSSIRELSDEEAEKFDKLAANLGQAYDADGESPKFLEHIQSAEIEFNKYLKSLKVETAPEAPKPQEKGAEKETDTEWESLKEVVGENIRKTRKEAKRLKRQDKDSVPEETRNKVNNLDSTIGLFNDWADRVEESRASSLSLQKELAGLVTAAEEEKIFALEGKTWKARNDLFGSLKNSLITSDDNIINSDALKAAEKELNDYLKDLKVKKEAGPKGDAGKGEKPKDSENWQEKAKQLPFKAGDFLEENDGRKEIREVKSIEGNVITFRVYEYENSGWKYYDISDNSDWDGINGKIEYYKRRFDNKLTRWAKSKDVEAVASAAPKVWEKTGSPEGKGEGEKKKEVFNIAKGDILEYQEDINTSRRVVVASIDPKSKTPFILKYEDGRDFLEIAEETMRYNLDHGVFKKVASSEKKVERAGSSKLPDLYDKQVVLAREIEDLGDKLPDTLEKEEDADLDQWEKELKEAVDSKPTGSNSEEEIEWVEKVIGIQEAIKAAIQKLLAKKASETEKPDEGIDLFAGTNEAPDSEDEPVAKKAEEAAKPEKPAAKPQKVEKKKELTVEEKAAVEAEDLKLEMEILGKETLKADDWANIMINKHLEGQDSKARFKEKKVLINQFLSKRKDTDTGEITVEGALKGFKEYLESKEDKAKKPGEAGSSVGTGGGGVESTMRSYASSFVESAFEEKKIGANSKAVSGLLDTLIGGMFGKK